MTASVKAPNQRSGPAVPGMSVHLIYASACAGVAIYLHSTIDLPIPPVVLIALIFGVWTWATLAPGSLAPLALIGAAIVGRLLGAVDDVSATVDPTVLMLGALLPITHQLASLAAGIPARGRFEWQALRPTAVRCLATIGAVELALILVLALG